MEKYKFFQNRECEFFPCHNTDSKNFNCLFCYCPLYALGEKCGGRFTYTNNIKDCSSCLIPHSKDGYEYVMSKIDGIINICSQNNEKASR